MSIQAKQRLTNDVAEIIGDFLTVTQTKKVISALTDQLTNFDVAEIPNTEISYDLVNTFLDALAVEGRAVSTLNRYAYELRKLIKFASVAVEHITTEHIREFLLAEKDRGIADQTLNGNRSVYSSFFGWLWKENLIRTNPCANIGNVKSPKKVLYPFTEMDIELLKMHSKTLRNRTIICFLLSTGARIAEVCALNRDDIDFQKAEVKVFGKGSKERIVYLDDVALSLVKEYLRNRTDKGKELFHGKRGRLKPGGVRALLKVIEKRSGVANVHPHRFRRTLATTLIKHGMPIQEVARILGHEKIETTMRYVHMDDHDIKSSYNRYR